MIYRSKEETSWRNFILDRDNKTCQHCGSKKQIHVHHIKPKAKYPELRFDIHNGICVCKECHTKIHPFMKNYDIKKVKKKKHVKSIKKQPTYDINHDIFEEDWILDFKDRIYKIIKDKNLILLNLKKKSNGEWRVLLKCQYNHIFSTTWKHLQKNLYCPVCKSRNIKINIETSKNKNKIIKKQFIPEFVIFRDGKLIKRQIYKDNS